MGCCESTTFVTCTGSRMAEKLANIVHHGDFWHTSSFIVWLPEFIFLWHFYVWIICCLCRSYFIALVYYFHLSWEAFQFCFNRYSSLENHVPELIVGSTNQQPLLETPGEVLFKFNSRSMKSYPAFQFYLSKQAFPEVYLSWSWFNFFLPLQLTDISNFAFSFHFRFLNLENYCLLRFRTTSISTWATTNLALLFLDMTPQIWISFLFSPINRFCCHPQNDIRVWNANGL